MPIHTFGNFRYDAEQRVLFRGDAAVPLAPKAIDTLQVLLERRGRIVEKGELMKLVWPDTTVEEIGLARNISILRKALEESSDGSFIETYNLFPPSIRGITGYQRLGIYPAFFWAILHGRPGRKQ